MRAKINDKIWYLDSWWCHHITGDKSKFSHLAPKNSGYITFDDNAKGKIIDECKIAKKPNTTIDDVLLVGGLKQNLLNISKFCDRKFKVVFESQKCIVYDINENVMFIRQRHENIYIVDLLDSKIFNEKCDAAMNNEP